MKKTQPIIDMTPVKRESVSAAEFVRIVKTRPNSIARSRFVAPRLGERGFGRFDVEYTMPLLRHAQPA